MIAHGVSRFIKERLFEKSDPYTIDVCESCGNMSSVSSQCKICNSNKIAKCNLPYASKLLAMELNTMGIKTIMKVKQ